MLHSELTGLVVWLLELSQDDISRIIRNPPEHTKQANLTAMTASNPIAEWLMPDREAWTQIGVKKEIRLQGCETTYVHSYTLIIAYGRNETTNKTLQ